MSSSLHKRFKLDPTLKPTPRAPSKWEHVQLLNLTHKNTPQFIPHECFGLIGAYYCTLLVDRVPHETLERLFGTDGMLQCVADVLLSFPGMYIAGGAVVPGPGRGEGNGFMFNGIDFYYNGPEEHVYNLFGNRKEIIGEYDISPGETRADVWIFERKKGLLKTHGRFFNVTGCPRTFTEEPDFIRSFFFDYQQCAITYLPGIGYVRYRTREAVEAHLTQTIQYFQKTPIEHMHLKILLSSALVKGYTLPAGVDRLDQTGIDIVPCNVNLLSWKSDKETYSPDLVLAIKQAGRYVPNHRYFYGRFFIRTFDLRGIGRVDGVSRACVTIDQIREFILRVWPADINRHGGLRSKLIEHIYRLLFFVHYGNIDRAVKEVGDIDDFMKHDTDNMDYIEILKIYNEIKKLVCY